jgi:hypothetical protein
MSPKLQSMKQYGNLLISKEGRVFMKNGEEYPYFFKFNRKGETDGYKYVNIRSRATAVHKIMGRTWVKNPLPGVFDRVDHISRIRTQNNANNLRWVNAHLNAINRDNINTKWDADVHMWYACYWCKGVESIVGWFSTFRDAHLATRRAKVQLFDRVYNDALTNNLA